MSNTNPKTYEQIPSTFQFLPILLSKLIRHNLTTFFIAFDYKNWQTEISRAQKYFSLWCFNLFLNQGHTVSSEIKIRVCFFLHYLTTDFQTATKNRNRRRKLLLSPLAMASNIDIIPLLCSLIKNGPNSAPKLGKAVFRPHFSKGAPSTQATIRGNNRLTTW